MRDRYTIVVGLLFAVLIAIAFLSTTGDDEPRTLGLDRLEPRWPLPEFAVPRAEAELEGDANVAQDDCESAVVPCPQESRRTPACRVDPAEALRVCDFFHRPLVLSFWFSREEGCVEQQDVVDAVRGRYGDRVGFLSLNVRDERETVRELVRRRGWRMPVGYDRDGAVAALYGVGGCPTIAFAYPGGTLHSASIGVLGRGELTRLVERLLRATDRVEPER